MNFKVVFCWFAALNLFTSWAVAEDALAIKIFDDPRSAVKAAQVDKKDIVFFLIDEGEKKQKEMLETFTEELNRMENAFVLVKCQSWKTAHKGMFTETFKKDISTMPVAVVTNSVGKEISDGVGTDFSAYEKMLIESQIKGGRITNPLELAVLKDRLKLVGKEPTRLGEGFLAPLAAELKKERQALTPVRDWTKKDKTVFKGLMVKARGDHGDFIDMKGDTVQIKFNDLIEEDIEYLKKVLK